MMPIAINSGEESPAGGLEVIDCGSGPEAGKKRALLIFRRENLLYDIKNYCFIEGHIMVDSHDEVRHTVQDVGEEGNIDRVTRMLDIAHADIIERLYPFTEREIDHPVVVDMLKDKPVYGIFLNVPATFSQTTLNLLGRLIHELMVCVTTADWMSITNPPKEETWRRKAEATLLRINQVKSLRTGKTRIRPHWM